VITGGQRKNGIINMQGRRPGRWWWNDIFKAGSGIQFPNIWRQDL